MKPLHGFAVLPLFFLGARGLHLHRDQDVRRCVRTYADDLDKVRQGLGGPIRTHPLLPASTSSRAVVIGAGSGNTGTHSIYLALKQLGFTAWHAAKNKTWDARRSRIKRLLHKKQHEQRRLCRQELRNFNYTALLDGCDAVVDMPTAEIFLNMYLSFPNAQVILSTRPPASWVEGRTRVHPKVAAPIQEPCGLVLRDFTSDELAKIYALNNGLVRCLVPRHRLLEFDLWADPKVRVNGMMGELGRFLNRPTLDGPFPYIVPGVTNESAVAIKLHDAKSISSTPDNGGMVSAGGMADGANCPSWLQDAVNFPLLKRLVDKNCEVDIGIDEDGWDLDGGSLDFSEDKDREDWSFAQWRFS
mmetsp:Transcript_54485/g.151866  ORF Transcript_54485/g.151866 Transcript_54485/m.151866 type:complete len:358 (+) Transcript_54485:78-1151(+)